MKRASFTALLVAVSAVSLSAAPTFILQTDAGYVSSTTLLHITDPEGSIIESLSDSNLSMHFFSAGSPILMDVDSVPDGWATWGSPPNTETSTPMVLTPDDPAIVEVLFQLSRSVDTFGLELEPDDRSVHTMTATFLLGGVPQATLERDVSGNGGALLFAATNGVFDAVDVVSDGHFGAAQFRYAIETVPEPPTGLLFLIGLCGAMGAGWLRKARK